MPRSSGLRLGPYEITASLGAGGMGEVYRATDTNLKRAVAIKVPVSVPLLLSAHGWRSDEICVALSIAGVLATLGWIFSMSTGLSSQVSGEAVYRERCSACHDLSWEETRALSATRHTRRAASRVRRSLSA